LIEQSCRVDDLPQNSLPALDLIAKELRIEHNTEGETGYDPRSSYNGYASASCTALAVEGLQRHCRMFAVRGVDRILQLH
jgi:hypothetical protein